MWSCELLVASGECDGGVGVDNGIGYYGWCPSASTSSSESILSSLIAMVSF